ncbi:hypothetical protein [Calothrix sp. PCC 7507]|uniref:hypothetical protein n=1 Tax=Calothrix sp. PCC 7507 TaxID=99598 RepID=UPI00031D56D1|nr:hypothetical protein [Calothrix sp. PCC 7507]
MYFIKKSIKSSLIFIKGLLPGNFSENLPKKNQQKAHDYSQLDWGIDYIFEPINLGKGGYMTGIGKGIKIHDYIILQKEGKYYRYQVEQIDYYSDPPDMWIASLKEISVQ